MATNKQAVAYCEKIAALETRLTLLEKAVMAWGAEYKHACGGCDECQNSLTLWQEHQEEFEYATEHAMNTARAALGEVKP